MEDYAGPATSARPDEDYPSTFTLDGEPVYLDRLVFSRKLRALAERSAGGGGNARGDFERAERLFQRENGLAVGEVSLPWRMLMTTEARLEFERATCSTTRACG